MGFPQASDEGSPKYSYMRILGCSRLARMLASSYERKLQTMESLFKKRKTWSLYKLASCACGSNLLLIFALGQERRRMMRKKSHDYKFVSMSGTQPRAIFQRSLAVCTFHPALRWQQQDLSPTRRFPNQLVNETSSATSRNPLKALSSVTMRNRHCSM